MHFFRCFLFSGGPGKKSHYKLVKPSAYNYEFCISGDERRYRKWISRIYTWAACNGTFLYNLYIGPESNLFPKPGWLYHSHLVSILNSQSLYSDVDSALHQRIHTARPVNSNSLAFLVTGIYSLFCLFIFLVLIFSINIDFLEMDFLINITC